MQNTRKLLFLIQACLPVALVCYWAPPATALQEEVAPTTFYVVRHADRDGTRDALTDAGKLRAEQLATLMKTLRIQAVYSTNTNRTKQTAQPTADSEGKTIRLYGDLTDEWFETLKSTHAGQAVLIVAHSNTSGEIAKRLGATGDLSMEEDEFDRLFIVTVWGGKTSSVALQFGGPTGPDR